MHKAKGSREKKAVDAKGFWHWDPKSPTQNDSQVAGIPSLHHLDTCTYIYIHIYMCINVYIHTGWFIMNNDEWLMCFFCVVVGMPWNAKMLCNLAPKSRIKGSSDWSHCCAAYLHSKVAASSDKSMVRSAGSVLPSATRCDYKKWPTHPPHSRLESPSCKRFQGAQLISLGNKKTYNN